MRHRVTIKWQGVTGADLYEMQEIEAPSLDAAKERAAESARVNHPNLPRQEWQDDGMLLLLPES